MSFKNSKLSGSLVSGLFVVILAGCLLISSCSNSHREKEVTQTFAPKKLKVLVVGIDGMEPSLVDKFVKKGMMPNFQHIVKNGQRRSVSTQGILSSPVIWTTMATGVSPRTHGITDFISEGGNPPNSSYRKVPAFWNILHINGVKAATLAWWLTWPAEKDAGIMIGPRVYWQQRPNKVYPSDIIDTDKYAFDNFINDTSFTTRFTDFKYSPDYKKTYKKGSHKYIINHLVRQRLIRTYIRDTVYKDIALELGKKEHPEVMSVYFQGLDHTQHAFWQYMEPEPFRKAGWTVDEKDVKTFGNIIPEYHRYIDDILGDLLTLCDENTNIVLLSDHGFHADPSLAVESPGLGLSGNHQPKTIFVLSGPEVKRGRIKPFPKVQRQEDFLPTLLYMLDLPIARDIEGRPLKEYFTDTYNTAKKIKTVDTYRGKYKKKDLISSKQDGKVLDDLRGLGYIK